MDANDKKNISGNLIQEPSESFAVRSATSGVGWDFEDVPPVAGAYIGVDDQLLIAAASLTYSSPLTINIRMLGLDGLIHPIIYTFTPGGSRGLTTQTFRLMEGWILSCTVTATAAMPLAAYCYANVAIQRAPLGAQNQYETLVAGYVHSTVGLSYPQSTLQRQTDGAGIPLLVTIGNPAAGADVTVNVPNGARWRIIAFRATLTTAVAVANRDVSVTYNNGGTVFAESPSGLVLAASSVNTYCYFDGATLNATAFNGRTIAPLPNLTFLQQLFAINTATTGIQAADQWSGITLLVHEWLENL